MAKELKKELVADAALACFLASGYSATSVDEISRASGVSKGGIYWHFKSKEDIFLYLVERWEDKWTKEYLSSIQGNLAATDKLTLYMEHRLQKIDTNISTLILEFLQQAKEVESFQKMHQQFTNSTDVIIRIIEEAFTTGEFKFLDPKTVALSFLAIFSGISFQLLIHGDKQLLEKTLRTSLDIFLNGILAG